MASILRLAAEKRPGVRVSEPTNSYILANLETPDFLSQSVPMDS